MITIETQDSPDRDSTIVKVDLGGAEFLELMCAAEYLCAVVASRSNLGFEAALDKIMEGVVTWSHQVKDLEDKT